MQCKNRDNNLRCGVSHPSVKTALKHSLSITDGQYKPEGATDEDLATAYEQLQYEGLKGKV